MVQQASSLQLLGTLGGIRSDIEGNNLLRYASRAHRQALVRQILRVGGWVGGYEYGSDLDI